MGFNKKNIDALSSGFEYKCIFVLIEGYRIMKVQKEYQLSWEEEQLSAKLISCIETCESAKKWNIDIVPEYRLYSESIIKGKKSPKSAARIDMRFGRWINQKKMIYFSEAKNLCENNWEKTTGTKVNASNLQHRYVRTGINHFINEYYPGNGCLAGYVLEGKPSYIIEKINLIIQKTEQRREILVNTDSINNHTEIYKSNHFIDSGNELNLKHIFLKL